MTHKKQVPDVFSSKRTGLAHHPDGAQSDFDSSVGKLAPASKSEFQ